MKRRKRKSCVRKNLNLENLEVRQLLAVDGFASFDGVGNNEENPEWGSVDTQFVRIADSAYEDGISTPARSDQANARDISNALSAQDESIVNDRFITAMWFQWGQFLDHDINRVFTVGPFEESTPTENLDISEDFPFVRTSYDPETGTDTPREHINRVSSFIDASVVYGSSEEHATALRTLTGGQLRSTETPAGELLPFNTTGLINVPAPSPNFFVAGDVRVNENVGLTSMQTLWMREHNRIAEELAATEYADADLTDSEVDEEIYQRSRQIVMGLIQNITYNEFLPSTVGFNAIPTYSGYDPSVNPEISTEFATAVYRIGHTTLSDELLIGGDGDSIELADAFFQPGVVADLGIEGLLEGLTIQEMQESDSYIVDGVRNFLDDGPGFDLAAINIQRGRDHGLPDFNSLRAAIGLDPISDFSELTSDADLAQKFEEIYGTPDNADPWIAMIAEDHVPGTMTGETIYAYMVDQFTRLRDGDRFYFENALEEDLAAEIKATRLSDVIERNTDLDVQDEVFWTRDTLVFRNGLDNEWLIRDFGENGGAEVVFFGEPGIRDPNNREETAPVQREDPINAVIVAGINELGDGFFIPNALVSSPLADEGIDEFIITADIDFFEGYGLGGNDIWVFESEIDSVFASGDAGNDVLRTTQAAPDAEVALTGGAGQDRISVRATAADIVFASGGGGNDRIQIDTPAAETLEVLAGGGNDRVNVRAPRADSVLVSAGGGNDILSVLARDAGTVGVNGGSGNDRAFVSAENADRVRIRGGAGHDRIVVRAEDAGSVRTLGERGNDNIVVEASNADLVDVRGGADNDRIFVRAARADAVEVRGNNGNDRINVDARRADSATVLGGEGNDRLGVRVSRDTETDIDGGPGRDQVIVHGAQRGDINFDGERPGNPGGPNRPDGGNRPGPDGNGPGPDGNGPGPDGNGPGPDGNGPGPDGNGPGPDGNGPGPDGNGPGPDGNGPGPDGERPERPERPDPDDEQPEPNDDQPDPAGDRPDPDNQGPNQGGDRPGQGNNGPDQDGDGEGDDMEENDGPPMPPNQGGGNGNGGRRR